MQVQGSEDQSGKRKSRVSLFHSSYAGKEAGVTSGGGNYYSGQHCSHRFVWQSALVLYSLSDWFVMMILH